MKRKYKVLIAYDGTGYSGWQFQENAVGIQQVVEEALQYLEGAPVRVFGSSRTDAGVHAKGFVGHFHLTKPIPPKNLVRAMNSRLPEAVRILKAAYAKEDFDARLSAKGKEYRYQLYQADILPPHLVPYWTFCHRPLDLAAMREAAGYFVGRHDFVSFAANPNRELESTERTIHSFEVKKAGPRFTFVVRGDGFLYKQVRSMVGFLIAVGKGHEKPAAVKELLEAKSPRTARVETAPARGLFLWKVFYGSSGPARRCMAGLRRACFFFAGLLALGGVAAGPADQSIDQPNNRLTAKSPYAVLDLPPSAENSRNSEGDFALLKDGRVLYVYSHYLKGTAQDHDPAILAVGATKQLLTGPMLTQFILERTGLKWDGVPLDGVTVEDLDRESFDIFRRNALETGRMSEADLAVPNKMLLEKLKLLVEGKLTRAAVLLFHSNPEKWVTSCYSRIGKFENNADLLFNDEIHGSLLVQAEKLVELLYLKYLIAPISYRNQTRIESYPYSKDAIRELVRNALMHQDFINGQPVQLSVHPDRLYLFNAGGLPKGWKVGKLFEKHGSEARNELIAGALYRGGFVETWGRGIEKVCRECTRLGVPNPAYEATESGVMVSVLAANVLQGPSKGLSQGPSRGPSQGSRLESTLVAQTAYERILCLCVVPKSAREIMKSEGRTNLTKFRQSALTPMVDGGVLELTVPDKPNSRLQRYRLTAKGRETVANLQENAHA